jgi:ribose transport system substrate-binding protein
MRNLFLSTVAAITLLGMGQSPAAELSKTRIVVIVKSTASQYWSTVFEGARMAGKVLGVEVETLGAPSQLDVERQVAIMENAVAMKSTAIAISASNAQALADPIAKATEAGIPVVMIDSKANTDKYATFLATNNETGGRKAADRMAQCVKARVGKVEGKVAHLTAQAGAQSFDERDKGFTDGLKAYPGLQIAAHRIGNNQPSKALSDTEDLLTRFPDLVGIYADSQNMGEGAGTAVAASKLGSKVCLIAFDSSDNEKKFLNDGVIDALIVQNPYMMGYAGVWFASAAAQGVVLPKYIDTGVTVVTKDNFGTPAVAGLLNPKNYVIAPFLGQ